MQKWIKGSICRTREGVRIWTLSSPVSASWQQQKIQLLALYRSFFAQNSVFKVYLTAQKDNSLGSANITSRTLAKTCVFFKAPKLTVGRWETKASKTLFSRWIPYKAPPQIINRLVLNGSAKYTKSSKHCQKTNWARKGTISSLKFDWRVEFERKNWFTNFWKRHCSATKLRFAAFLVFLSFPSITVLMILFTVWYPQTKYRKHVHIHGTHAQTHVFVPWLAKWVRNTWNIVAVLSILSWI